MHYIVKLFILLFNYSYMITCTIVNCMIESVLKCSVKSLDTADDI